MSVVDFKDKKEVRREKIIVRLEEAIEQVRGAQHLDAMAILIIEDGEVNCAYEGSATMLLGGVVRLMFRLNQGVDAAMK